MNLQRREALKAGGGLGLLGLLAAAGLITPGQARAEWNKAAFDAKTVEETLKALGAGTPANSADVQLTAPDIAENGAVVPVGVVSTLAGMPELSGMSGFAYALMSLTGVVVTRAHARALRQEAPPATEPPAAA